MVGPSSTNVGAVVSFTTLSLSVADVPATLLTVGETVNVPSFKLDTSTSVAIQVPSAATVAVVVTLAPKLSVIVTVTV